MQITRGKQLGAEKVVIYGPEGIGKSTLASMFPNTLFIDTEGSTKHMDVARLPKPSSWSMLIDEVNYVKNNPNVCSTLAIDTADWAEHLCVAELCAKSQKKGIEDFGYGKGYVYLAEEFGRLLNLLEDLIELGINVVMTAHAQMRKFEQPDELGAYDRWEMKLQKKTAPLVKEWADMVLFANYKTHVVNVDGQGAQKGTNKAQGGKRIMYTTHHPCWDAKNRHGLPDEIPLDYSAIAHCITVGSQNKPAAQVPTAATTPEQPATQPPKKEPPQTPEAPKEPPLPTSPIANPTPGDTTPKSPDDSIPKPLADLMAANNVTTEEIQQVVAQKGYYPLQTPISRYDPQFINGVLVGAWDQVFKAIEQIRIESDVPF